MTLTKHKSKVLILTGFHRSATSVTANYLSNAGLNMGNELMGANINNPKGYFEDIPAVKLHEAEFNKAGTSWQFHDEIPLISEDAFLTKYITQRSNQNSPWGVKDPRICLFLDDWHKELGEDGCYFFVVRHWSSCIESLLNRHSKNLAYGLKEITSDATDIQFWTQPDLAAKMWLSYNKRLVSFAKKYPDLTIIATQRALFNGAPILKMLNKKFLFELDTNAKSPFDKSLFRDVSNNTIFESLSYSLQQELNNVWLEILALAEFKTVDEEPIIMKSKELPAITLNKVRAYTPKGTHVKLLQNSVAINSGYDWLTKLKNINSALEMGRFLNKSSLKNIGTIKAEVWFSHVVHTFLINNGPLSPECAEVLFASIRLLMRLSQFDLAIEQLVKRVNTANISPYVQMFLGQCYQELDEFLLSKSFFEKAIKTKPNKAFFHTNYAKLLVKYDENELAEEHFHLAYQLESNNPICVLGYCQFLDRFNRTIEAVDLLHLFMKYSPHPMVDALLIKLESKIDLKIMLRRTKEKVDKANLYQWLAKTSAPLSYNFSELDLSQRCFQHWDDLKNKLFLD